MKAYNKDSLDELADVFCAWLGGIPEERKEISEFGQSSGLSKLLSDHDLEEVFNGNAYFPEETFLAVYSLIPVKLKTGKKEIALFPQTFNRLNRQAAAQPWSRPANISFAQAAVILQVHFPDKQKFLQQNKENLLKINRNARRKSYSPEKYKLYRASLSEEKKEELREKSRQRMRRLRAEKPEETAAAAKKYRQQLPQETKERYLIASRVRRRQYEEKNREEIRRRNNERRRRLKEENPELLKEIDRFHNQNADRKQSCRKYYLKNKEIIAAKAKDNPKTKEYKRRYKAKQRFKKTTGKIVLALLQAIADSKLR